MPIHDLPQDGQSSISHHWPILILYLVHPSHDLAPLDLPDGPMTEGGIDKSVYLLFPVMGRSEPLAFARDVFLADRLEGVRSERLGINTSLDFASQQINLPPDGGERGCWIGADGQPSPLAIGGGVE